MYVKKPYIKIVITPKFTTAHKSKITKITVSNGVNFKTIAEAIKLNTPQIIAKIPKIADITSELEFDF
jgi:hypothetical protein